jgi:hypothetical protein
MDNETIEPVCTCPACIAGALYPEHNNPEDRPPVIVGIDVSSKCIAIGIVPVIGELCDVGALEFKIESKKQNERCVEIHYKLSSLLEIIDQSVDITSIAIESPVGFGGKLLPLVGAVTSACGPNSEWYAPTTWQKIIRNTYTLPEGEKMKDRIHAAITEYVPEMNPIWTAATEDQRDAICIALAHRIETLQAIELTDQDMKWLQSNG